MGLCYTARSGGEGVRVRLAVREIPGDTLLSAAWGEQRPVVLRIGTSRLPPDLDLAERARGVGLGTASWRSALLLSGPVQTLIALVIGLRTTYPDLAAAIEAALKVRSPRQLLARGRALTLGERTLIMGIVNMSPDSFSGDGLSDPREAVEQARRFLKEGANILDVGAMSTRPRSEPIPEELEARRLRETITRLRAITDAPISADTYRPVPARAALEAGADILNDVSGLRDPAMTDLAAEYSAGVVIMHMRGTPADMQLEPRYEDVVDEVYEQLGQGVAQAEAAGIEPGSVMVDPGIGFGKTFEHNLELLRRLKEFQGLGRPLLVGTSRKSFIGRVTGSAGAERLEGTAATVALAIAHGADIVRVHDVRHMAAVARMSDAVVRPTQDHVGLEETR